MVKINGKDLLELNDMEFYNQVFDENVDLDSIGTFDDKSVLDLNSSDYDEFLDGNVNPNDLDSLDDTFILDDMVIELEKSFIEDLEEDSFENLDEDVQNFWKDLVRIV